jgi:hypothetical protein
MYDMYVCMYYTYIYTHTPIHPYTPMPYTHTPTHPYTHTPIHPYTHTPIHTYDIHTYDIHPVWPMTYKVEERSHHSHTH